MAGVRKHELKSFPIPIHLGFHEQEVAEVPVLDSSLFPHPSLLDLTLLGAGAVGVGPRVGRVFRVPRGSALFCPVKVVGVILSEKANVPILKATVELSCQNK